MKLALFQRTTIMTMSSGDVIACGTHHEGPGPDSTHPEAVKRNRPH